jgi:hypothetical protein
MQIGQTGNSALEALRQQYAAVPAALRDRRQWVVWQRMPADERGKFGKKPITPDGTGRVASPHDWTTWATFDEALHLLSIAPPMLYGGLGFMMTKNDPFLVVDFDDIGACNPAALDGRMAYQNYTADLPTYVEMSPSGRGWHVWVEGHLDGAASEPLKAFAVDFLCHSVFVTVTGRSVGGAGGQVLPGQHLVTYLDEYIRDRRLQVAVNLEPDSNKPLYLTDKELYDQACGFNSHFRPRYHGLDGNLPGEWSHTFYNVLGTLDKLTGDPRQIRRLIMWSPLVTDSPPTAEGVERPAKAERIFNTVLLKVRSDNKVHFIRNQDPNVCGWAHGKALWDAISQYKREVLEVLERDRRAQAEMAEAEAAASLAAEREAAAGNASAALISLDDVRDVVGRFAPFGITMGDMNLTLPPGMMGRMVLATMGASRTPLLRFAIPAALATVSGIVGRSYRVEGEDTPLTLNCILLGESATGKTQTMKVWTRFIHKAYESLGSLVQRKERIISNETASVPGIFPDLMASPSAVWFIEEASSQLSMMSNPSTGTAEALRNFYNQLYDAGEHATLTSVTKSSTNNRAGMTPIRKLCTSTYWSTTPQKFSLSDSDVLDGFASRVIVVRHSGRGGKRQRVRQDFPEDVTRILATLLTNASQTDGSYATNDDAGLASQHAVDFSMMDDLNWGLTGVCDSINDEAIEHTLPRAYQMFSRVPANALRVATILAIADNPWFPVVTEAHLRWAYSYLVQNILTLLLAMQRGEVGDSRDDEVATVKRVMEALYNKGHARDGAETLPGIPKYAVVKALSRNLPYSKRPGGGYSAASNSIKRMVENGQLKETESAVVGAKRATSYLLFDDG